VTSSSQSVLLPNAIRGSWPKFSYGVVTVGHPYWRGAS
jgi:hypothetical protein